MASSAPRPDLAAGCDGQQNSFRNEPHRLWPDAIGFPDPIGYTFDLLVRTHSFSTSQVLPINSLGQLVTSFDASGNTYPAGTVRTLPPSTIYGVKGTFPGPRIIYRGFRDFTGPYVAHCHNLAHEDHAMMFGWEIT